MQDIFAHTISRIDFLDGMVRIELITLNPGGPDAGVEPKYALHMPLGGFMRGALTLENFIREMAKRGMLPTPGPAAAPAPAEGAGEPSPTISPNFG